MHRILAALIVLFLGTLAEADIHCPDFKSSMLRKTITPENLDKREKLLNRTSPFFLDLFEQMYEKSIIEIQKVSDDAEYRIPRIIHQIWLGSPVPKSFNKWRESWMQKGWIYKLWTDEDVAKMKLCNQDLYDKSTNYGEKADILRLELLYRYGGIYADIDYECIKPALFERLNKACDYYAGFEPLEHGQVEDYSMFKFCNALMASIPSHPLIGMMIKNLRENYAYCLKNHMGIIERTGPSYITRVTCDFIINEALNISNSGLVNMFLPCTFFYPFTQKDLEEKSIRALINHESPEMAGIHYWSGTWRGGRSSYKAIQDCYDVTNDKNLNLHESTSFDTGDSYEID